MLVPEVQPLCPPGAMKYELMVASAPSYNVQYNLIVGEYLQVPGSL